MEKQQEHLEKLHNSEEILEACRKGDFISYQIYNVEHTYYYHKYYVTDLGTVYLAQFKMERYTDEGMWLRTSEPEQCYIEDGYVIVFLEDYRFGRMKFYLHCLVANTFINNDNKCLYIKHINGNRLDNRKENLKWIKTAPKISDEINRQVRAHNKSMLSDHI